MSTRSRRSKSSLTAKCASEKVTFNFFRGPGLFQQTLVLRGQRANRRLPALSCRQREEKRSIHSMECIRYAAINCSGGTVSQPSIRLLSSSSARSSSVHRRAFSCWDRPARHKRSQRWRTSPAMMLFHRSDCVCFDTLLEPF